MTTTIIELDIKTFVADLRNRKELVPNTGYMQHISSIGREWLAIDGHFDVDVSCSSNLVSALVPTVMVLSVCCSVYATKAERSNVMCCVQPESMIHG